MASVWWAQQRSIRDIHLYKPYPVTDHCALWWQQWHSGSFLITSWDCYFSSRDWRKISLHIFNAIRWWSLLKTELRWKAVMQMCHIMVALSLYPFVWYDRSTAIIFKCSLYYCKPVTWNIHYFICFMPSEISLNLSLKPLSSSEEREYIYINSSPVILCFLEEQELA